MMLDTDGQGNVLIRATGEEGRIVFVYHSGRIVIVNEHDGQIWTSEEGLAGGHYNAGKTAGIVKEGHEPHR